MVLALRGSNETEAVTAMKTEVTSNEKVTVPNDKVAALEEKVAAQEEKVAALEEIIVALKEELTAPNSKENMKAMEENVEAPAGKVRFAHAVAFSTVLIVVLIAVISCMGLALYLFAQQVKKKKK